MTMPDPVTFSLSVYQQQRFAARRAEQQRLTDLTNEAVTAIIADTRDPAEFHGWAITLTDTAILCTPPAESLV